MINDLPDDLVLAIKAKILKSSFSKFVKEGWFHATGVDYVHGRHIDVLTKHLQAVGEGRSTRLLVNIPPSCSKSTLISVMWPAWIWTFRPDCQFLAFSYSLQLAIRDNQQCRELIGSNWYQSLFPNINVTTDTDSKQLFELASGGCRRLGAIGGQGTGYHPDVILIDDPLSRDESVHPVPREAVRDWYFQTLSSRGLARSCAHVVSQQRLNIDDLSGHIIRQHAEMLKEDSGSPWSVVTLPMRFDSSIACSDDWRTIEGELLYPQLLDESKVKQLERSLGPAGARAQLQQDPRRSDTGLIKVSMLQVISESQLPRRFDAVIRFWDLASTAGAGDFTVGCLMAKASLNGNDAFFILDICRGQWSGDGVIDQMIATSLRDQAKYGELAKVIFERQPNGTWAAEQFAKRLRQFRVSHVAPKGSKELRAEPLSTAIAYSEVSVLDAPWLSVFLDEAETFPGGKHDDQIDACSGAFNSLQGATSSAGSGIILPTMTSTRDPSSWETPKCKNPSCGRPAFGIGSSKEYCCSCCAVAHEWEEEVDKHLPDCALQFNDWYIANAPVDNDRPGFRSTYRKRF
jgi:predicted phage terminase large subunit-like protein